MRIIFMGTPDFSVPALKALVEAGHDVIAVITQPDKPKGRGKEVQMPPVKEQALEYNIPVYQPVKARDPEFVKFLTDLAPDVMVVAAFGQLLPKSILRHPQIRLYQYTCLTSSQIPGCISDTVCSYQWGKGKWHYHYDNGRGFGYRRYAGSG